LEPDASKGLDALLRKLAKGYDLASLAKF